ncbi:hypothetical protein FRC07_003537, partial [Ceratobasidium sp. 392]
MMGGKAPEILNQSPVSTQADIYALGMTVLEVVTGQIPYADRPDMAVLMEVVMDNRFPAWDNELVWVGPTLALHDLLRECWNRESLIRPTATQIETRLDEMHKP